MRPAADSTTSSSPVIDQAVSTAPMFGAVGLLLVLIGLGLFLIGAKVVSTTLRSLDQDPQPVVAPRV